MGRGSRRGGSEIWRGSSGTRGERTGAERRFLTGWGKGCEWRCFGAGLRLPGNKCRGVLEGRSGWPGWGRSWRLTPRMCLSGDCEGGRCWGGRCRMGTTKEARHARKAGRCRRFWCGWVRRRGGEGGAMRSRGFRGRGLSRFLDGCLGRGLLGRCGGLECAGRRGGLEHREGTGGWLVKVTLGRA